jgi:hypothetical protein
VHAELAGKGFEPADGLGWGDVAVERRLVVGAFVDDGHDRAGEEIDQRGRDAHRAGTGTPAAVRGGEGLVQVVVHHVDAQVAGADDADDGVHVGAVAVDEAATAMDGVDHVLNALFEQAQGIGVGDHEPGDLIALGGDDAAQRVEVDVAAVVGGQLEHV